MISKTSTQVINAFIELAKLAPGEFEGATSIAKKIKAPQNYLGKLLQGFCSKGLLISKKGFGGGFRLGRDPQKITLFDIVEPIDNVTIWSGCALTSKKCSQSNPCSLHDQWKVVKETYYNFLKNTNIANLVKNERNRV